MNCKIVQSEIELMKITTLKGIETYKKSKHLAECNGKKLENMGAEIILN